MGTAMKHPVRDRVKPSFVIFDILALWRSTHMATVGVKGLVFPASQAVFTLIRVQVRVLVSLHWLASIALYCKQCYVMW